jgi:hypothetical protein
MLSAIKRNRKRREEIEQYLTKIATQDTENMISQIAGGNSITENQNQDLLDEVTEEGGDHLS